MITTLSARARRHAGLLTHLALAVACYFPLVFTERGRLAADTREAIYLDPGRFIHDALSMWNPSRALGTVTHQNIVLVWPMAVYYWLAHSLGIPLWLAQRVWTGSLFFLAGAGVLYLARSIRWARWTSSAAWPGVGPAVAAFAYALTPYVLQYVTRSSVLLAPWTALPWLIGLAARSLETRGWRHPALFALVTLSVAVNATALALVLLGPMLWIVWSVWGLREVSVRHALATVGRIAVLGVITSLWWVVALLIEGRYSLPLLSFTETIDQVAATSGATEILRGLGYWVVYVALNGMLDIKSAHLYLENIPVLVVGYAVVVLTVVGIVSMRWRQRTFFAALVVFGVVVGAGAYPTTDRSPIGAFFHDVASSGGIGLALRSTSRAVPLVLLGLACLLGAFVDALTRRMRRTGLTLAVLLILVTVVLSPAVVSRDLVDPNYSGPENIADAWTALIAAADQNSAADGSAAGTRMLELPGSTFAAYRWGTSYHEPITTGNSKTPTTWREQIPYGSPGSADLLTALDNRIQEGRLDPDALAPVARIMGVGQLVVRNDLAYERTHTVAPDRVWDLVDPAPAGLGAAQGFGPVGVNQPDPAQLQADTPTPAEPSTTYPEIALVPVKHARQLVQVVPVVGTVVLDGSGDGIVDAATAGVIDGTAPILYAATTRTDPKLVKQVLAHGGRIVLTDTNRRRVQRWRTTNNTTGITLRADQNPADEAGQYGGETSLDVFPGHGSDWETVALQTGAQADATKYGDVITFENGRGPAAALDGNPDTAWTVRPPLGGVGDSLTVRYDTPQHTDHLRLLATDDDTLLTSVDLRFDDGPPMHVQLDDSSRTGNGQVITFPDREVSKLQVSIAGTAPKQPGGGGHVGIAELDLGGVQVHQTVRLPVGLTNRLGASSVASPMSIVLTREDGDQTRPDPINFMEEPTIARQFSLPTARSFSLTGTAVPNNTADDGIASADPTAASECRTGIVSVDSIDVPVRVEPRPARAGARNAPDNRTVVACAPLTLSAGVHTVDTTVTG
ncbi:MAG: alpha-(1-_3)-arabinofuranosyltransferase family protein, partial [Acidimicrobiia bacterium]